MKVFTFKNVYAAHTYKDPLDEEKEYADFLALLNTKSFPSGIPLDSNSRQHNVPKYGKEIIKTVLDEKEKDFHDSSLGLIIIVEKFEIKNNQCKIWIKENKKQGIGNGGSSYRTILECLNKIKENRYIRVQLRKGVSTERAIITISRVNTGESVKDYSVAGQLGHFDNIKNFLKDTSYANKIKYSEGEKGFPVRDIIGLMTVFNPLMTHTDFLEDMKKTKKGKKSPINSYTCKSIVVKNYVSNLEKFDCYNSSHLQKILELHDFLLVEIRKHAKKSFIDAKFFQQKKQKTYFLEEKEFKDRIPSGVLYPLMWASSKMSVINKEKLEWKIPIEKIKKAYKNAMGEFFTYINSAFITNEKLAYRPDTFAKNKGHWDYLMKIFETQAGMQTVLDFPKKEQKLMSSVG